MSLPHRLISRLDVPGEPRRIEQRAGKRLVSTWRPRFPSQILPGRKAPIGDHAFSIVGHIGVWQTNDLLQIMLLMILQDQRWIGNEIVDMAGAHRSRMAEIVDLYGPGSHRKDSRAW